MHLAGSFLPRLAQSGRVLPEEAALEEALARLLQAGRSAWPGIALDEAVFLRYLAERVPPSGDLLPALEALHAADLYLVCACLAGVSASFEAFDAHYLAPLRRVAEGFRLATASADDVLQVLRARLLVAEDGAPPRIAGYTGRGPLRGWVRVAAARVGIDLKRADRPDDPLDEDVIDLRAPNDPELELLKRRYRPELEAAFRDTLAALPARDANVLRLHYLDRLSAEKIAALYAVNPRTVKQWLIDARASILRKMRRLLADRLRLSASQLDSVLSLVHSQLDVSLRVVLLPAGK